MQLGGDYGEYYAPLANVDTSGADPNVRVVEFDVDGDDDLQFDIIFAQLLKNLESEGFIRARRHLKSSKK